MTKAELFRKLPADMRAQVEAQYAKLPTSGRGNKYGAKAASDCLFPILRGIRFSSKAERDYGMILAARVMAGEITRLRCHPSFRLGPAGIGYHADFLHVEAGREIVSEVKGAITDRWRIIKQLWSVHGPCELQVVRRVRGAMVVTERIVPAPGHYARTDAGREKGTP